MRGSAAPECTLKCRFDWTTEYNLQLHENMRLVLVLTVSCLLQQTACTSISTDCFSLLGPCVSPDLCRNEQTLLRNACHSEDGSCQMQSSESCNMTIQAIFAHSLLSRECMCTEENPCDTLRLLTSFCHSYLDDEPQSAPDKSSVETQQESSQANVHPNNNIIEQWESSSLITYVPEPAISCLQEITMCLHDDVCNRQLVPFVQSCSAPQCKESLCRVVTRQFYSGLPENLAERLVFCQCERDDQDCQRFQAMLNSSSCKQDQTPPWSCLEMLDNCCGESLCRKTFETFLVKCFGPEDASYSEYSTMDLLHVIDLDFFLSKDKECRMAFVATMGSVLQSPCTCHGLDHHDFYRCSMLQQAIQNRSYYTLQQDEINTSPTQIQVTKSDQDPSWINDPLWYVVVGVFVAVMLLIAVVVVLCKLGQRRSLPKKQNSRNSCHEDTTKSYVL